MTIRHLGVDDHDAMIFIWREAGLTSIRPRGRDSREAFARQAAVGVQTVLGLEVDGSLVGVVVASHDGRKGWINRLAVLPDHRRRGYADQLLRAAEEALQAQGIQVIAALVEESNRASLELFRRAGYDDMPGIRYLSKRPREDA